MTMKLTQPQITALTFLSKGPWVAPWWGGKPHGRWPKELNSKTISKLIILRYVRVRHVGRFDRATTITEAGLKALNDTITETARKILKEVTANET
jgi:hypothetical protein